MKRWVLVYIPICFIWAALPLSGDELDDALQALKKNASRRAYSSHAQVNDQELMIPDELTDEDKAVDAKLREQSKNQDTGNPPPAHSTPSRPTTKRNQPLEPDNWLTPESLRATKKARSPSEKKSPAWLSQELKRRHQEQGLIDNMGQEKRRGLFNQQLSPYSGGENPFQKNSAPSQIYSPTRPHTTHSTRTSPLENTPRFSIGSEDKFDRATPSWRSSLSPKRSSQQSTSGTSPSWDQNIPGPRGLPNRNQKTSRGFDSVPFTWE